MKIINTSKAGAINMYALVLLFRKNFFDFFLLKLSYAKFAI